MLFSKIEYVKSGAESVWSQTVGSCITFKPLLYLFKSGHVLFSYDDDDIDNTIYMVEE